MDTPKALDLIQQGIKGLLDDIQSGRDPWINRADLADEQQITDEDVFEWIYQYRQDSLDLVTMDDTYTDDFNDFILSVMESSWYEELYHNHIQRARESILGELDWEQTKKSLMR